MVHYVQIIFTSVVEFVSYLLVQFGLTDNFLTNDMAFILVLFCLFFAILIAVALLYFVIRTLWRFFND